MSNESAKSGVTNTLGFLGVTFVALKLTGHIAWSWWWVTVPFWGPVAVVMGLLVLLGVVALIVCVIRMIMGAFK